MNSLYYIALFFPTDVHVYSQIRVYENIAYVIVSSTN